MDAQGSRIARRGVMVEYARSFRMNKRALIKKIIARLTEEFEARRREKLAQLYARLNGRLTDKDRQEIEGMIRLEHNQCLHVLISALNAEGHSGGQGVVDALRKLFGWKD